MGAWCNYENIFLANILSALVNQTNVANNVISSDTHWTESFFYKLFSKITCCEGEHTETLQPPVLPPVLPPPPPPKWIE